ncbi:MAG: SRPBCC domain-containing protein [Candidatus Pseudobacter hemicellulosilyticus]|uniref:SRPBCC domain-containing protein n=1 Tax=Candidatus Pseudobacter hemicellulosilyticus TaxID=3121375 RepID=A0AAJ5WP95_9BACT|nr:MAG: SRPBCC domain-containing protein [Pseudobacter sp.]
MNLETSFTIDRDNATIVIRRAFAAPVATVWNFWTVEELLEKWWAPKPWVARTRKMDFRQSGEWLYAMVGPEGEEHWAKSEYKAVSEGSSFSSLDSFTDKEGIVNDSMPQSNWTVDLKEEQEGHTLVSILIRHEKPEDMDAQLKMGFREGMTQAMDQLDELLVNAEKG